MERNPWRVDRNISWYGPGLYGNGTACGQKLTKGLVGVAHRTLALRHQGRVPQPQERSRGDGAGHRPRPFVNGRKWDLSHGLCAKLKHCYTGSIEWRYASGD